MPFTFSFTRLIVFGGLPGTGKSTLARWLASELKATVYLRIDTLEVSLKSSRDQSVGFLSYEIAQNLAFDNLSLGKMVIVDGVNSSSASRLGWEQVAQRANCGTFSIEVRCSNTVQHRERVEARLAESQVITVPTWAQVSARTFEPWSEADLQFDTADETAAQSCQRFSRIWKGEFGLRK